MQRALEIGLDAVGLAGAAAIVYGAGLIYVPAGFIIGGAMAVGAAFLLSGRAG